MQSKLCCSRRHLTFRIVRWLCIRILPYSPLCISLPARIPGAGSRTFVREQCCLKSLLLCTFRCLIGPSVCCRWNCREYRVPPVDTLSMMMISCCPVSSSAALSSTTCDGRCGVAGACPGSTSHCIDTCRRRRQSMFSGGDGSCDSGGAATQRAVAGEKAFASVATVAAALLVRALAVRATASTPAEEDSEYSTFF